MWQHSRLICCVDFEFFRKWRFHKAINSFRFLLWRKNIDKINAKIDYERDFNYDYFGFKTLERSYLLKVDDKIAERP